MALTAQSIIQRCVDIIQDETSIRWPVDELVRFLNDGQREIVLYRPDSTATTTTVTLAAGTQQTLPAGGAKLMEVIRNNTASSKRSVRLVNREILDAQLPGWHDLTGKDEVVHYMYDARDPTTFYVYPPATVNAKLDVVYSVYPTDVAEPADGSTVTDVTGDISLPDVYGNALQDYIMYRAYSKDAEYTGNANRAQAHYGAFANALGIEIKSTINVAPNPVYNPNVASRAVE